MHAAFPYRNSWFQLAVLTLVVSGAFLAVDYGPSLYSRASQRYRSAPRAPQPTTRSGAPETSAGEFALGWSAFKQKDYVNALQWWRKAAADRNASAEYGLGILYEGGSGVSSDFKQAIQWFQKSAEDGQPTGISPGIFVTEGLVKLTEPPCAEEQIAWIYELQHNYQEAISWDQKALASGHPNAEFLIGTEYESLHDYPQAIEWLRKAQADWMPAPADAEIGYVYLHDLKDYAAAGRWYRAALDTNDSANGDSDLGTAEYWIGYMDENGLGVPRSRAHALQWYQRGAATSVIAANAAARLQGQSTTPSSPAKPTQSAPAESAATEIALANAAYGHRNYKLALSWLRKAAAQGNSDAENDIGLFYQNGWSVPRDYGQAMRWYRKAVAQGELNAENNVGWLYQNGWGVPQDYSQAMRWYRKAAVQGHYYGEYNVGWLYLNGRGVPQDYGQAMQWFRKSAAQGFSVAEAQIGLMYQAGYGVTRDLVQAKDWYQKAAAHGNTFAKQQLDKLKSGG